MSLQDFAQIIGWVAVVLGVVYVLTAWLVGDDDDET